MLKIAVIGAGSIGFSRLLLKDLMSVPEFKDNMEFAFHDISRENLDMVYKLCKRDMEANGSKSKITATLNRREALRGANYVLCMVRVGGVEAFKTDIEIPLRYGVDQCVGDTLCAGGIMYAQRTIHQMLAFCKDASEVAAKDCLFLSYVNPMAMNTWACNKYGYGVKFVGLCHGVEGGWWQIAKALNIPQKELDIICAGINHQTWYIQVKHKGQDMTGKILEAFKKDPELSATEKVRIDMMERFGYYSTESNGHLSEYVPWYRKRPGDLKKWIHLGAWINGETGGYLRIITEGRNWFKTDFPKWMKEAPKVFAPDKRSHEHGSFIIESLETRRNYRGHFNVVNNGCITNLPNDAIVEVPGYVDGNGMSIPKVGDLPLGAAAVCNASISVQRLSVEAAVKGDDMLLRQAMMLDPLVGAVCNPPEIWQMVDELLVTQEKWLPQYKKAIVEAKKRLRSGKKIKARNYKGIRLHTRSVAELRKEGEIAKKRAFASDKAAADRGQKEK